MGTDGTSLDSFPQNDLLANVNVATVSDLNSWPYIIEEEAEIQNWFTVSCVRSNEIFICLN